jgi:hypothetical protein
LWHSFLKGGTTATMDERSLSGVRNTLNIVHDKVVKCCPLKYRKTCRRKMVSVSAIMSRLQNSPQPCSSNFKAFL